ncbi:SpoIIIAH-like protein [compost metagenome]
MICENLISTKGFKNSVVFVNDNSVSAVIEAEELKPEDLAQIQNILQRELKVELENLHISNKKAN